MVFEGLTTYFGGWNVKSMKNKKTYTHNKLCQRYKERDECFCQNNSKSFEQTNYKLWPNKAKYPSTVVNIFWVCRHLLQVVGQNANRQNTKGQNAKWFAGILSGLFCCHLAFCPSQFLLAFCLDHVNMIWHFVRLNFFRRFVWTMSTWFGILSEWQQ